MYKIFSGHAFYMLYHDRDNKTYNNSSFHPEVWNNLISHVPELLTLIGFCYYTGRSGVTQNLNYAVECFKIAAAAGQGYDRNIIQQSYKRLNDQEKMGESAPKKKGWLWGGKTKRRHRARSRRGRQTLHKKR